MRSTLLSVIFFTFGLGGCFWHSEDDVYIPQPERDFAMELPDLSTPANPSDGGMAPTNLGSGRARPADQTARHVQAGGSVTVPNGQYGFTVTANGQGGYRVAWVDAALVGLRFHGSIFIHGAFSGVSSTGMNYATASGERLDFESQPGAGQLGYVDFVTTSDPITIDVLAGSQNGSIWYPDASGAAETSSTPATFTSP
jgi:hypothetical protein